MISGIFHKGSGLGNQLHRYVATRCLALDKGYEFGMVAPELFKGSSFMNMDMGKKLDAPYNIEEPSGKVLVELRDINRFEEKTNYYNPEFNFIEDNTIIDGEFQDERYFDIDKVDELLKVEPLEVPDDVCVIGFRGGEFTIFPELFLPAEYWAEGIFRMLKINKKMKFEVHTDDVETASKFLKLPFIANRIEDYKVIHDIGINWRSMRYAKHAIIANSSFYILPRLLSKGVTIAPRYWARHNTKEWNMPQNYYKRFLYI